MVLSSVCGSITIDAAGLDTSYSYIVHDSATGIMLVSDQPIKYGYISHNSSSISNYYAGVEGYQFNSVPPYSASNKYVYCWYVKEGTGFVLVPVETNGTTEYGVYNATLWPGNPGTYDTQYAIFITEQTSSVTTKSTQPDPILGFPGGTVTSNYGLSYNGSTTGTLPEDIGGQSPEDIVNETLNATTDVSTEANVYVTNITNVYTSYTAGTITLADAKAEVSANVDSLSALAQSETATLKDAINVQNGLTYGQIVNDTLLQDQEEAFWNERDIQSDVAQKVQTSDQAEIDYLESLISETEASISDLSPSQNFTAEQISTASEIVEGIWENPIIKKIIPVAACFMVICVALGVKYRL